MSITKNERKWKSAAWRTEFAFYRRIADMHAVKYDGMTSMVSAQILKRSVIREGDQRIVLKQLQLDHITWEQLHYIINDLPKEATHTD